LSKNKNADTWSSKHYDSEVCNLYITSIYNELKLQVITEYSHLFWAWNCSNFAQSCNNITRSEPWNILL